MPVLISSLHSLLQDFPTTNLEFYFDGEFFIHAAGDAERDAGHAAGDPAGEAGHAAGDPERDAGHAAGDS